MNVLSLGATFGVLIAVFQHGWLSGPLGTLTVGGLSPIAMVVIFAFAFAVSMDYEVFLISRIKEYVDAGADTNTAVRHGLRQPPAQNHNRDDLLGPVMVEHHTAATASRVKGNQHPQP